MGMNLFGKSKTSDMVTVICGIKKSLPCTKVLGFIAYRDTTKILGIGAAAISWGDMNTVKSWKGYSICIDVSD